MSTKLPDFLVIGAQKAATSSIHHVLSEHPQICVPNRKGTLKEIHFFDREVNYSRGLAFYSKHFRHCAADRLIGEVTPNYLFVEEAARRIQELLPDARLIACLREPISRAYSQYKMHVIQDGLREPFRTAVRRNPEYLQRGRYVEQLERFRHFLEEKRIYVTFYEDLVKDPGKFYRDIFVFLKVDPNVEVAYQIHEFKSGVPRSSTAGQLMRYGKVVYKPLRRVAGETLVGEVLTNQAHRIKALVAKFNWSTKEFPRINDDDRAAQQEYFLHPNQQLQSMLGRLPPTWRY